jgi:glycosyltransferase involved in cell wall biosynthesis
MVRVLHVIDKMDPRLGGVCHAVRMLIPGLAREGVYNEVVSMDDKSIIAAKEKFVLHALGAGKGPWNVNAQLIPWLIKNYTRFDVIIAHGLWLYHTYAVRKALTVFQNKYALPENQMPKLFVMPHGMLDPYFQRASGRKLKALRNWVYWKLIEQKNVNMADGLFFTCANERHLARQPFNPYRPKKEIVIGLGIEAPPEYTCEMKKAFLEKCPELKEQRYILFLSRIHEKKGVDLLIRAFAKMKQDEMETKNVSELKLVIAGPGMETIYGKIIHQLVSATGSLKDSVIFTGMLSGDAKWGAFYGCEAFILPSHQENFGMAVVEALACSKPVLISNQVNIWTDIHATGSGIVYDDTVEGTISLLESWCNLSSLQKKIMSSNSKSLFTERFAIEPTVKKLIRAIA